MKKLLALTLAAILALSLAACGKSNTDGSDETAAQTTAAEATAAQTEAAATEAAPADETTANASSLITDGSKLGVLQTVTEQNDLVIKGLIITTGSGHHEYPSLEELVAKGYQTEGLNSEYFVSEWVEVYGDVEGDKPLQMIVLPNDPAVDYTKLKTADLLTAVENLPTPIFAEEVTPDAENNGRLGSFYVHQDYYQAGLYNVFFASGDNICSMVQLNVVPMSE